MKNYDILFCDLDGTLIDKISENLGEGIWNMKFNFDVFKAIKFLNPKYIFIITNQSAIGKTYSEEEFEKKINYVEASLSGFIQYCNPSQHIIQSIYCPSVDNDDPFRKPNTGMLEYMVNNYVKDGYEKTDMLMIGDASGINGTSNIDFLCAQNFGIHYCDVNEFIKIMRKKYLFNDYERQ